MTSRRGENGEAASALRGGPRLRAILWNGWRGTLVGVGLGLALIGVATWLLSTGDAHYDRPGVPALMYVMAVLAATFAGRLAAALVTAAAGALSRAGAPTRPPTGGGLAGLLRVATGSAPPVDEAGAALVAAATAANGRGLPDDVALLTVTVR